jgi:hypothetical protein
MAKAREGKRRCGLAAMPAAKRKAIQKAGIVTLWQEGKAHRFTKEDGEKGRARQKVLMAERVARGERKIKAKGTAKQHRPLWLLEEEAMRERWKRVYKESLEAMREEEDDAQ